MAKNFDASQEQRWSWTTGALDGLGQAGAVVMVWQLWALTLLVLVSTGQLAP